MRCPVCGAENPDDSKYCSKCLTNLSGEVGEYFQAGSVYGNSPGMHTVPGSLSERVGISSSPREDIARKNEETRRKAKIDLVIYGSVFLAMVLAIVLSLTIWGNKTPIEVAEGFMQALNDGDIDAMSEYVWGSEGGSEREKMQKMIDRLGADGSFQDLVYSSNEYDFYTASVSITGGTYIPSGTSLEKQISESDRLQISMESQEGRWYVDIDKTYVFP